MKKSCSKYRDRDISMFVDEEMSTDGYKKLAQHLSICSDCRLLADQYKNISSIFNKHADQKKINLDPEKLKKESGFYARDIPKRPWTNIYLKLASITAILMISLFAFQGELLRPKGPSAIVTSVNTDFSSVMIIETQKDKHTIIWFSET